VDAQNRFYFENMSRAGNFRAQVVVDPSNASFQKFFDYCADPANDGTFLRLMRRHEHNKYVVKLRFVPEFKGFQNDAYADLGFHWTDKRLSLKVDPSSIIYSQDFDPDFLVQQIREALNKQIKSQSSPNTVTLDLTGYDDLVCDLIQGKASLSVNQGASSNGPLIVMDKVVEPQDIQTTYKTMQSEIPDGLSREETLFMAGRLSLRAQAQTSLIGLSDHKIFELVKKLMNPEMSAVADLNADEVSCVAASMQSYHRPTVQHVFQIGFKFDSLEQVRANNGAN
jgi:hypothetical protein